MISEVSPPSSPFVFISSTVKEFRDLRSAIRYMLCEQGATVYVSEAADFDVRGDRPAIEECFENIRNSDYYILIIGGKRGNLFAEGTSITRQEYRVARDQFLATGRPILHFYLRGDVECALSGDEVSQANASIDDPVHLVSFIGEVQQPGVEGAPSFLTRFYTFEELADSVKGRLNLGRTLSETLIRHSLVSELSSNLAVMARRIRTGVFPVHHSMARMRDDISIGAEGLFQPIVLSDDHVISLALALVGRTQAKDLSTKAIEQSIDRGIFLKFNPGKGTLEESPIHRELRQTLENVRALRELDSSVAQQQWDVQLLTDISSRWGGRPNALEVDADNVAYAFAHYDRVENIFTGHLALCRLLLGVTEEVELYQRRPLTPLGKREEQRFRAERVLAEEVIHLVQNDIWPLGTRVPREVYGKTRDEQVRKIADSMHTTLSNLGMDPAQFPDAIKKAAEAYLDYDTASPEEGIEDLRPK